MPKSHGAGDRPRRIRAIGRIKLVDDLTVRERGQILRERIVQIQSALFDEHHDGRGGDRLRHRRQVEDRVHGHLFTADHVSPTDRGGVDHLFLVDGQRHQPGDLGLLDRLLEIRVDLRPIGKLRLRETGQREQDDKAVPPDSGADVKGHGELL